MQTLPASWETLKASRFHPDLVGIAERFAAQANPEELAFLDALGSSLFRPFDPKRFDADSEGSGATLKRSCIEAIESVARDFGDRVPPLIWEMMGAVGMRERPTEMRSILREQLPFNPLDIDAALHASGIVRSFSRHLDTRLGEQGLVLEHECGCGCCIRPFDDGEEPPSSLIAPEDRGPATAAFFAHVLATRRALGEGTIFAISPELQ